MKKVLCSILLMILLLIGCSTPYKNVHVPGQTTPLTLMVATDLHYIAAALSNDSPVLKEMMAEADGKMTVYIEPIIEAFVEEVLKLKPDALILTGDLTFNGAKESHIELAEKLARIKEVGIPVYVIPGNHDIDYAQAAKFNEEGYELVESVSSEAFQQIYGELMEEHILIRDKHSNSYVAPLREDLWLIGIDTNTENDSNRMSSKTEKWLEKQLKEAERQKVSVITLTHQNILKHNGMFTEGFVIRNAEELQSLLNTYGVRLNLSGHMHVQHIEEAEGLYDIATASLAVSPHAYGIIKINDRKEVTYSTQPLSISEWAKSQGHTSEILLDFEAYSRDYFDACTTSKLQGELARTGLSDLEQEKMLNFATQVNRHYFAGTIHENKALLEDQEVIALWESQFNKVFFANYLESILLDERIDYNQLEIQLD